MHYACDPSQRVKAGARKARKFEWAYNESAWFKIIDVSIPSHESATVKVVQFPDAVDLEELKSHFSRFHLDPTDCKSDKTDLVRADVCVDYGR